MFRIFRVIRVIRLLRAYGPRRFLPDLNKARASATFLLTIFLVILVVEFAGATIYYAEANGADSNIHSAGDAIWWGLVTITTVGYGDRFPTTELGRLIGVLLLFAGIGLFSVLTGFISNIFLSPREEPEAAVPEAGDPRASIRTVRALLEGQEARAAPTPARRAGEGVPGRGAAATRPGARVRRATPLQDRRFFGLLGEIVDGNPTQEMLDAAFAAAGLPWSYVSMAIPRDGFADAWTAARILGFAGLNVTKPFKVEAAALADRLTPAAAAIGAVNCVFREGDALVGDNTDGRGLARAVAGAGTIEGARVAVLGAGGAARAAAVELAFAGAAEVTVVARREAPARTLVEAVASLGRAPARLEPWSGTWTVPAGIDVLVHATSVGMLDPDERPAVDLSGLSPGAMVADVVIGPRPTGLLVDAAERGLVAVHGNEMLVHQAAIGFEAWTGRPADLPVLRAALAEALGG
jgi:shikimate dehydrogenase